MRNTLSQVRVLHWQLRRRAEFAIKVLNGSAEIKHRSLDAEIIAMRSGGIVDAAVQVGAGNRAWSDYKNRNPCVRGANPLLQY